MTTNLTHLTSLGNLITALQTHTQAISTGIGWGNASEELRSQISEHLRPLEDAGLQNFVPAPFESLRRFAGGEEVALAELAAAKSQLEYVSSFLQSLNGAGNGTAEHRLRRMTGPLGLSIIPPSSVHRSIMPANDEPTSMRVGPGGFPLTGTNRDMSVIFGDIVGFSALGEQVPHDQVFVVMNEIFERLEEAVESEGGEVPGNWGDALLAIFGAKDSKREINHARAAIRAALKMRRILEDWNQHQRSNEIRELRIRFGIHSGEAAVGYLGGKRRKVRTAIGRTINIGARLEPQAVFHKEEGQIDYGILTSQETLKKAGQRSFVAEFIGSKKLKGIDEEIETYRIYHEAPPSLVPRGTDQTNFIGRYGELAELRLCFNESRSENKARMVIIKGAAGEGKSRLGDRFIQTLGQDVVMLMAQGEDREALMPYEGITSAIAAEAKLEPGEDSERARNKVRYVMQAATSGDPDASRDNERHVQLLWKLLGIPFTPDPNDVVLKALLEREHELWEEIIKTVEYLFYNLSRHKPVLLIIEDLHWIDPGTLTVIDRLLKKLQDRPFFILGLSRPTFVDLNGDLISNLNASVISLSSLSDDHLSKMAEEILPSVSMTESKQREALIHRLIDLSGRNPYLITEMSAAVAKGMMIEQDLATKNWHFISTARGLKKVVPLPSGAMGFLQAKIDMLEHDHQEALRLASIIGAEFGRADLVGLAESIRATSGDGTLLSDHLAGRLADNPQALLDELVTAKVIIPVEQESEIYQFPHALLKETAHEQIWKDRREALHRAMAHYLSSTHPDRLAIIASHLASGGERENASEFYYQAGEINMDTDPDSALEFYRKGYTLSADPGRKLRNLRGWDETLFAIGKYTAQEEVHNLSLPLLDKLPAIDRAGTYYRRGRALNRMSLYSPAERDLQEALKILEGNGNASNNPDWLKLKASIFLQLGLIYGETGPIEASLNYFEMAYQAASVAGDKFNIARGMWGVVDASNKLGRYEEVLPMCVKADKILRELRDSRRVVGFLAEWSRAYRALGMYDLAERLLRRAENLSQNFRGIGGSVGEIFPTLGRILQLKGEIKQAIELMQSSQDTSVFHVLMNAVYLSMAYYEDGQLANALDESEKALAGAREQNHPTFEAAALMVQSQIERKQGNTSEALRLSQAALELFNRNLIAAEFDLQVLANHIELLMATSQFDAAWQIADRTKAILVDRLASIEKGKHRRKYLSRVCENRKILQLWQVLKEINDATPKNKKDIQQYLQPLEFYPYGSLPEMLSRLESLVLKNRGKIVQVDDHEIAHQNGRHENAAAAAQLFTVPLASLFSFLISSEVTLETNPGEIEEFFAKDIHFRIVRSKGSELYGIVDWEMGSPLKVGRIGLRLSKRGKMRELLEGEVRSEHGTVILQFESSLKSMIESKDGLQFEIGKMKRPKQREFGTLKFTLIPQADDKTVVILEMGRALYTQNPSNFLKAFDEAIRERFA